MVRLLGSRAIEPVYIWDLRPTESSSNSYSIACCAYNHCSILVISSKTTVSRSLEGYLGIGYLFWLLRRSLTPKTGFEGLDSAREALSQEGSTI